MNISNNFYKVLGMIWKSYAPKKIVRLKLGTKGLKDYVFIPFNNGY